MRFSDTFLDEIRDRLPISEVIGSRVSFDKKKTNQARGDYWACCPFHGEKTPSFHCEDRKGRYHCFGCGVSGDHFRFLVELEGLSFPEAVERLADQAGLAMPVMDKREQELEKKRATLFDVMQLATDFFKSQLQAPVGASARAYLRDRGLSSAVQAEFDIGFAPESRNALKEFLASKDISQEQMIATGLLIHGPDIAVSYDRFRNRIMFPIPDSRGRTIAFGGRALNADALAKYLNSPETELFHKSNVLYNFLKARKTSYDKKQVIATEGYMDVIAMHAGGFENCVAPLGTALTERQMALLWRMHSEPILCFDGDNAGLKAAYRAIDMVLPGLQAVRSVKFAMLPEGLDPDDLLRQEGPQAMKGVLDASLPLVDMIWNRETIKGIYETPEQRAELEAKVRSVVNLIKDEAVKRHYDQNMRDRLANLFGSGSQQRNNNYGGSNNNAGNRDNRNNQRANQWQQGKNGFDGGRGSQSAKGRVTASPNLLNSPAMKKGVARFPMRESMLVMSIVNHPAILTRYFEEFSLMPLQSVGAEKLRQSIVDTHAMHPQESEPLNAQNLMEALNALECGDILTRMDEQLRHSGVWQAGVQSGFEDAIDGWLQAYKIHIKRFTLQKELEEAERTLESESTEENFERLLQIKAEIHEEEGTEALIDGFGIASGRPAKGF
ncbi:MAG: DNA primase [Nitratireductor sp.]